MISKFNLESRERICKICEKQYTFVRKNQKYCSDKCRHEAWKRYMRNYIAKNRLIKKLENGLKYSEAEELINNMESIKSEWTIQMSNKMIHLIKSQQFSKEIIKDRCWVCGSKEKLVIHHVKYLPSETKILCTKCHTFLHNALLKKKKCQPKVINNSTN